MKTPIDNGTAGATLALLDSGDDFQMVDLWAITLNGGAVIRWHGAGVSAPLTFAGETWLPGPGIDRGKISTKLGVEVATLDVNIAAAPADLINGAPLIAFAQGRGFDGATIILYRGFLESWAFPYAIVGGASTTAFATSLTEADGFFAKGVLTFTSGANAGLSRAIQSYTNAGGLISTAFPLPFPPGAGDTFTAVRGCLLTMADCTAQGNLARFRGQPFIPPAITGNGV